MATGGGVVGDLRARVAALAAAVGEFARDMAFEMGIEAREAARTGFGVPRAVSSAASFACFAVAAAGTASLTLDLVNKFVGARECDGCCGWEALTCRECHGRGKGPAGQGEGVGPGQDCIGCSGTGAMKCPTCNGDAWKLKLTMDRVLDLPTAAWNAYSMCQPVEQVDDHQMAMRAIVQQRVLTLSVPPRPPEWKAPGIPAFDPVMGSAGVTSAQVSMGGESSKVDLKSKERAEKLLAVEARLQDTAWEAEWRSKQVDAMLREANDELAQFRRQPPAKAEAPEDSISSPPPSTSGDWK